MYVIVSSIIALFILGTSFSIYTYNKIGGKQGQVVLGNIYMSANEKSITLNEIRPMDINEGLTNGSKYQFSVEGYNTSSKNIYYGVYINYGDEISTKSRFKDEDIMMYLTETKNGETREVYGPGSLKDFNDKLIYASTIDAAIKKEEKVDIDYELTVWLSDKILISDTVQEYEGKNIYTTEEYENSYASISVKVEGDFEEKNIQTGEESIAATIVSSQTEYDLSESIETREDIKIVITSSKKQPIKLTITNLDTSIKEEITNFSLVDGKYIYERLENQKARYSYSFEYSDGMISQTYYYNVNIVKDEYVSKPSSSLCKNIVYNGNQQQLTTITENKSYKLTNYNQTNAGSYVVTAILNEGYKWDDKTDDNVDFTCSISKKSVAVSWGDTITFTYNGNAQAPTASAESGVSGETLNIERTTGRDANSYTSTASISSVTGGQANKDNYTLTGNTKDFKIDKATPTITLSATSGTVVAGKTMTFTEKANVAGSFSNASGTTSVATISPASYSGIAANTEKTVTITGVAGGSSTITVNFTPTDTTNYNNATAKTYTATIASSATIPTAANYCQTGLVYNASSQTLTKTAGTGYTFSNNTRTNAGSQTVTATLSSGYRWSDNSTGTKTFSCSIAKATPTITLSATSGTVVAGKTMTFTEKANVAGSFSNASGTTSVATISPASYSGIAANTEKTVTITGVAGGSSTITVNFTPTDTTNYNNATAKTYTATIAKSATIPTAANYCQTGLVYNANSQTLTKTAGTGYTFSNNTRTNAGSQTITATLSSGYRWNDNTTGTKTFSCSIAKATPTITLSATSGSVYAGATTTFTEKANVAGDFSNSSGTTSVATVSPTSYTSISANTAKTVTIAGQNSGNSTITVNFTPTDTTNYNNATAKTYNVTVNLVEYTVRHSQMNNDGTTYTVVNTVTGSGKVGSQITPDVNTYPDFTSPQQQTFTLTDNPSNNVFEYRYTRNCFGTTCDYCNIGDTIGTCLYNNASELGLWSSGIAADTEHNNVRYIGTKSNEPNNYICIGSTTDCTGYHLHRIIGVFEPSHRIKVIYPTSMGNNYYYSASYSSISYKFTMGKSGAIGYVVNNLLTNANLGYDTYITGTTKWSDMMETVTKYNDVTNNLWKSAISVWLEKYYAGEQSYSAKVYLTSAADMLLSTGSTSLTFESSYDTIKNSWLHTNKKEWIADIWNTANAYFMGGDEGNGTQNGKLCSNSTSGVTNATTYCSGDVFTGNFTNSTTKSGDYYKYRHGYRPNFEMVNTTLFCGGSGTSSDPYKVGSGSC